jgi:hypothetical protein
MRRTGRRGHWVHGRLRLASVALAIGVGHLFRQSPAGTVCTVIVGIGTAGPLDQVPNCTNSPASPAESSDSTTRLSPGVMRT